MYRMLSVDLTNGKIEEKDVTELFERFVGGTGVLTYLAMQEIKADLDPFS
jgi:aldehyde:ferredoxin oxidoreductase